ncbi:MAG: tetratricopeptide repeat protein [Magnetovibrionaceae bacterium]
MTFTQAKFLKASVAALSILAVAACQTISETALYQSAQANDPDAQYELGMMYLEGDTLTRLEADPKKAVSWLLASAQQGNANAQFEVAKLYDTGTGTLENDAIASKYFKAAADQGITEAQVIYGQRLIEGVGVDANPVEGVSYLQTYADASGDTAVETELAARFLNGDGVEKDTAEAAKWLGKLGAKGDLGAMYDLGKLYYDGDGVEQDMVKAEYWLREPAAEGEYILAQFMLGTLYRDGHGVTQHFGTAAKWFDLAANQGHVRSQVELAKLFRGGKGVERSLVMAHKWLNIGATITKVEKSDSDVGALRASVVEMRDAVAEMMVLRDVAKAQMLAAEWWEDRSTVVNNAETLQTY